MILRQYLHQDPVAISDLFGCAGHAAAPSSIQSVTSSVI
jgi:hypothetical protein